MNKVVRFSIVVSFFCITIKSWAQPTMSAPTVSGITHNSATLGGTIAGSGITARGTAWKTSSPVIATDNQLAEGGTTAAAYTHTRSGLPSGTQIFFVAYGTNGGGTAISSESSFYTLSAPPSGQPATFSAATSTAASETEIDLSFSDAASVSAAGYLIYRRTGGTNPTINIGNLPNAAAAPASLPDGSVLVTTISSTSATTYTNTGLTAGTQYSYAVVPFGYNGSNANTYNYLIAGYKSANAFTLSIVPDNQPGTVTATAVSKSQINLTFTNFATLGNSNGYVILRRIGSAPATTSVQDGVAPASLVLGSATLVTTITTAGVTSYNDTGLANGTDYHYAVVPFNWDTTNPQTYNYKTGGGFTTDNDVTFFSNSTITLNGGTQGNGTTSGIDYINYQTPGGALTAGGGANSISLAQFRINDTGGNDGVGTTLTSITFTITNFANVSKVGLFDGNTNLGEQNVSSGTISFSSLSLTAPNNGNKDFQVRATFNSAVTDNQQINLTITSATAAGSGSDFNSGNAGGAATTNANAINVIRTKLVFTPTGPINATANVNFGPITVQAFDALNNFDGDAGSSVSLSLAPSGTITSTPTSGSSLSSGQIIFNPISISTAGNFTMTATYGAGSPSVSNATMTVNVTSPGVTVTPGTLPLVPCYSGNFQTLSNIVITEFDNADFAVGSNVSFSLLLPPNFVFDDTFTSSPTSTGVGISSISALSYIATDGINFNIVQFRYTASAASLASANSLIISGLKIKYIGTSDVTNQKIKRLGGSAVQAGNADTDNKDLGVLSAQNSSTTVDFSVNTVPGEPVVNSTDLQFQVGINSVQLVGNPSGGSFTGFGVSPNATYGYVFSPSSVGVGTYNITYTVVEASTQACKVSATKEFTVYSSTINNLQNSYCLNGLPSSNLSVTSSAINNTQYGQAAGTYSFYDFVYEISPGVYNLLGTNTNAGGTYISIYPVTVNFGFFTFTYFVTFTGFTSPPQGATPVTFDPQFAGYKTAQANLGQVRVYYRMKNNATPSDVRLGSVQFVRLNAPPDVAFSIPKTRFCKDETPVNLTGNPPPSTNTTIDFFTATGQSGSLSSSGNPIVWTFDPGGVSGVAIGSPQTFNITYTYQDPATFCTNKSAAIPVTVYDVPTNSFSVSSSIPLLCQGGTIPTLTASSSPTATYKWYKGSTLRQTGSSFTPSSLDLDVNTPGPSSFNVTQTLPLLTLPTSFGCESAPQVVTITVNPKPSPPGVTSNLAYCKNSAIANITASNVPTATLQWYAGLNAALQPINPIATSNPNSATPAELSLSSASPANYVKYVTQTLNSCQSNPSTVNIIINDLPSPKVDATGVPDLTKICKTFPVITLKPTLTPGTWSGTAASSLFNQTATSAQLDPSSAGLLAGQSYNLVYTYTDILTSCSNNYNVNLNILPSVSPSISISNACEGTPFTINNTSTILSATPTTTTIATYGWSFIPGPERPGATPIGSSGGTYQNPIVSRSTGLITYTMTTSDNCPVSQTQLINVGEIPDFDFNWRNPCQPGGVQFQTSVTLGGYAANDLTYAWNFAKDGTLSPTGGNQLSPNPLVNYTNLGKDVAELTVTGTKAQQPGIGALNTVCTNTKSKNIFIVPQLAASKTSPYNQSFESTNGDWVTGGINSSWKWMTAPSSGAINSNGPSTPGTKIWKTDNALGAYNAQERSFILSPCVSLDTGNFKKPVLSFDVNVSTPNTSVDGFLVQYTTSDDIETNANWTVLGDVATGKNWYNTSVVSSSPFSPPNGISNRPNWVRAAYPLDAQIGIGNKRVKFRVVFTSGLDGARGTNVGAAIDNVYIGDRTRITLVENFTNTSLKADPAAKTQSIDFNSPTKIGAEAVRLQYHTGFPGVDPINTEFAAVHNPRASFYGIDNSPAARIDGSFQPGPFGNWAQQVYNDRILEPTSITINRPVYTQDITTGIVKIKPSFTTTSDLQKGTYVFTVLAEKTMNAPRYKGQNGEQSFNYVVKNIFPTPAGYRIPNDVTASPSSPATIILPEYEWADQGKLVTPGNGAIIVFLQKDPGPNLPKDVLQAYVDNSPLHPTPVTGLEPEPSVSSPLSFYPVPADKELVVSLPEAAQSQTPFVMYDAVGKAVHHTAIEKGQQTKTINTQDFAPGVYLIQLETDKGTVRKKVMVVH